tara:strand:+ start:3209 stop:3604 length:396 start_codon:yes stop_codon:yes gene_type:complete
MNNKAIYFIGGFIWALVSSRKAYAPNINTSTDATNIKTPTKEAIRKEMALRKKLNKERDNRNREVLRKKVGNWTPNDTSCNPCVFGAYQGSKTVENNFQGDSATERLHQSWCALNCASSSLSNIIQLQRLV